jgi:ATP-dependent RNA helicase RhlE
MPRYNSRRSFGRPQYNARPRRQNRTTNRKKYINPELFVKKAIAVPEIKHAITHSFRDFQLDPQLFANIEYIGFVTPLPIQDQAIPHVLKGADVLGVANTGTGKTAAFAIPLIHNRLKNGPGSQTLIMAPTRELAIQIEHEIFKLSYKLRLKTALCVGGQPIYRQKMQLENRPDFIIATPGRLKDLLTRDFLKLNNCRALVLDEVDRMLDMGFIKDIKFIMEQMPAERQSLFFTATITSAIEEIIRSFMHSPVEISVKSGDTASNIEQDVIRVSREDKLDKLHQVLGEQAVSKAVVFGETKYGVEKINKALQERGVKSVSIHGNKTQGQRQQALRRFRSNEANVMVATDVAARGLDIDDVSHVINFDTPQSYEDYVHRIGRTGRAGKKGFAFTFI